MLPETPRGRLRWAIEEAFVILGILAFWIVAIGAVALLLALLTLPFQLLGLRLFRPLFEFARSVPGMGTAVLPLTVLTASLYVLVRGGSLLIDRYHEGR